LLEFLFPPIGLETTNTNIEKGAKLILTLSLQAPIKISACFTKAGTILSP